MRGERLGGAALNWAPFNLHLSFWQDRQFKIRLKSRPRAGSFLAPAQKSNTNQRLKPESFGRLMQLSFGQVSAKRKIIQL